MHPGRLAAIVAVAMILSAHSSSATTITVNEVVDDDPAVDDGRCSLREAVIAANTNAAVDACPAGEAPPKVDTIEFDPLTDFPDVGFFSFEMGIAGTGEDAAMTGDLDVLEDTRIIGNLVFDTGLGGDVEGTVVNAGDLDRVFHVRTGARVLIQDVGVSGGEVEDFGGGIQVDGGTELVLRDSLLFGNSVIADGAVGAGGGINAFGEVTVEGGGIAGNSVLTISEPTIGAGGGINSTADLALSGVLMANDVRTLDGTAQGGNIRYGGGNLTIEDSFLLAVELESDATARGGNLYVNSGQAVIRRSALGGSSLDAPNATGAGIYALAPVTLINTTMLTNNVRATDIGSGGAIFLDDPGATLTLNNVTMTLNTAKSDNAPAGRGGGIFNAAGALVRTSNSIIAGNSDTSGTAPNCVGTITSLGFNLLGDNTGCDYLAAGGDRVGTAAAVIDPVLGPGTGINQFHLQPQFGSPAIDNADPDDPSSGGSCAPTDARDEPRAADGDDDGVAVCDMGAIELQAAPAARPATAVPALGTRGLSLLAILLAGLGALAVQRATRSFPYQNS